MEKNKKIVLLIEDDTAIIDVYETALKAAGINIQVITWGKQAMEMVKEIKCGRAEKPSLVLLDLILPDINGIEILKEIKENEETKNINVFVLSNYTNEEILTNRIKPDKFILKTEITPTELVKLVKNNLK